MISLELPCIASIAEFDANTIIICYETLPSLVPFESFKESIHRIKIGDASFNLYEVKVVGVSIPSNSEGEERITRTTSYLCIYRNTDTPISEEDAIKLDQFLRFKYCR